MDHLHSLPGVSVTVPALAVAVATYWLLKRISRTTLPLCSPPGAEWPWGHDLALFSEPSGNFCLRWFEQYGPAMKLYTAVNGNEVLTTVDPAALQHIFVKKPYAYPTSEFTIPVLAKIAGKSLLWAQGDTHVAMRRLLNPSFSSDRVKKFADDIVECYQRFEAKTMVLVSGNGGRTVINAPRWFRPLALDIIGRTSFDHDFECGDAAEAKELWERFDGFIVENLTAAASLLAAIPRLLPWIIHLPIPALEAQARTKVMTHRLGREMLAREKTAESNSVLRSLVRENGDKVTDEMLDHITTLILAGQETVPMTTAFIMWELARKQDVQDKLREEILSFEGTPTYDDLTGTKLPWLDAVFKETLRLHPGVGHMERVASEDDIIPLKFPVQTPSGTTITSIPVKAGQTIYIPVSAADRLKCVWGQDADVWRPERWIEEGGLPDINHMNAGHARLFAFSQGARVCIGLRLAVYQIKFTIFHMIRTFKANDTGADIVRKNNQVIIAPQPLVRGREAESTLLPVELVLLE